MTVGTYNRHQAQRKKQAALAAAFPQGIRCQKCLEFGHWSYECTGKRKVVVRQSRTQLLKRNLKAREEGKLVQKKEEDKGKAPAKKKKKCAPSSSSDSSSSDSSSDSDSSDSDSSASPSSGSDSSHSDSSHSGSSHSDSSSSSDSD